MTSTLRSVVVVVVVVVAVVVVVVVVVVVFKECKGGIPLPFQSGGDADPLLYEGMAIILLDGKGMVVTFCTLRRRVATSFTLRYIYCLYIVYMLYIHNIYQSEGMAHLLLKVEEISK